MPPQRRKDVVGQRRRVADDGDDEGSIITEAVDDSQSEASVPTDAEDEADAEFSDTSEPNLRGAAQRHSRAKSAVNSKNQKRSASVPDRGSERASSQSRKFEVSKDTEAMMSGLSLQDQSNGDALDYETLDKVADGAQEAAPSKNSTPAERRKQEHEEYKQKRDADPAFIPTRGQFFMHDQRTAANGYRQFGRGRGRGRGGPVAYAPGPRSHAPNEPSSSQWTHDLHESLLEPPPKPNTNTGPPVGAPSGPANSFAGSAPSGTSTIVRSFSTQQVLGKVQMRVALPDMKEPIIYSDVAVTRYTKLPNHRPPLRRDKPVRLSLPEHPVRYIFPSMERSFIFIPRALRPNQQGFGRGRGRGISSLGGFSSRRTSIYNGSMYSPSIAMSRRSSIARDGMSSPVSMLSARPVVRLPPGAHHQHTASGTPIHSAGISATGTPAFGMPPPQKPQYRENWPMNIQMHQPRPQKPIPVHGFENPASHMAPGLAEQQPFHHQVPVPVNGLEAGPNPYAHGRQGSSYSIQPSGTPLSNIPERAIHAQPFQPYQQGSYPSPYNQPAYYHPAGIPAPGQYAPGAVVAPMYVQSPQQGGFIAPTIATAGPPAVQPSPAPNGLVAHEQNGMVYYYDPSQVSSQQTYPQQENYSQQHQLQQQHSYQPQMGGMMNVPDGYYYGPQVPNGTIYYPQ